MNDLEFEDIKLVAELPYRWDKLTNKTMLVSGGTGFIGTFLCEVLRYRNKKYNQNIKVISLSRHPKENNETVIYMKKDINEPISIDLPIDYILHLASNTHPEQYKNDPVGTITGNVFGAYNLLVLAKEKRIERFVLASSCEIYGDGKPEPMDETYCGYIDSNTARAGYNESKRVSESLCQSFSQQFGVESCVVRLARVFGPDKTKNDTKAMSQFIKDAVNGKDIVLKSDGRQKYSYVYIADAVSGILKVLFDGMAGEAYNVSSNYDGMCLGQYAAYLAKLCGKTVIYKVEDNPNASRSKNAFLDNSKIRRIGFAPLYSVLEGLKRTFEILSDDLF